MAGAKLIWETHRRYADIQYVARGVEAHGWLNIDHAPPVRVPYDEAKDFQFYENPGPAQRPAWFDVPAGHLTVFRPDDIHAPSQPPLHGPAQAVVKLILKVRLSRRRYGGNTAERCGVAPAGSRIAEPCDCRTRIRSA